MYGGIRKRASSKREPPKMSEISTVEHYDKIYTFEDYKRHYKQSSHFPLYRQIMAFLKKFEDPKILEVGCGAGEFAHYLHDEELKDYKGFDFSEEAIKIAVERVPQQQFWIGDAENERNYRCDYDTVVAIEVLEHVDNDIKILRNMRKGAKIVFSVPAFRYPGHKRWFKSIADVTLHYFYCIHIKELMVLKIGIPGTYWFVSWGLVK